MAVRISSALADRLRGLAAAAPAREVCGLLLGTGDRIDAIREAANVAPDPASRFEVDPAALLAAHRAERGGGPRVVGHYHSHPNGVAAPSAADAAAARPDGRLWLIVSSATLTAWRFGFAGFVAVPLLPDGVAGCAIDTQSPIGRRAADEG